MALVDGARWSFRRKDAGSARSRRLRVRLRTQPRGEQRVPAAQPPFRRVLLGRDQDLRALLVLVVEALDRQDPLESRYAARAELRPGRAAQLVERLRGGTGRAVDAR